MKNSIIQHLKNKSFYLIGIGGAGMMGIAELLHNMGFSVRGSDIHQSNATNRLKALNIKIFIGHDSSHINLMILLYIPMLFLIIILSLSTQENKV